MVLSQHRKIYWKWTILTIGEKIYTIEKVEQNEGSNKSQYHPVDEHSGVLLVWEFFTLLSGGFGRPVIVCNPPPSQLIALLLSFLCSRANDPESHTCVASTISRALCSLFVHQISLPRALSRRSFFLICFEWTYFNKDAQNTRVRYNHFLFLKEVVC